MGKMMTAMTKNKISQGLKEYWMRSGKKAKELGAKVASTKVGGAVVSAAKKVNDATNKANNAINAAPGKAASYAKAKASSGLTAVANKLPKATLTAAHGLDKAAATAGKAGAFVKDKASKVPGAATIAKGASYAGKGAAMAGRGVKAVAKSRSGKVAIVAGGAVAANEAIKRRNTTSAKVKRAVGKVKSKVGM